MREIDWPDNLYPRVVDLSLRHQTRSLNTSISGFTQATVSSTQRWVISLDFNNLKRSLINPYRSMIAQLRGQANKIRVPVFNHRLQVYSTRAFSQNNIPHSDGALFSDGSGYSCDFDGDLDGTASGTKGDRDVTIIGSVIDHIDVGTYFNLGDHLYMCTTKSGSVVEIEPSLRETVTAVEPTLDPFFIGRLADDQSGTHPTDLGIVTTPSVAFEEIIG